MRESSDLGWPKAARQVANPGCGPVLTPLVLRVPCRMSSPLSSAEIQEALKTLPGWKLEGDALSKSFQFGSFREAISFMVRVAFEAEAMDHHPDWSNAYNKVAVRLTTHAAGNKVTANDVELAKKIKGVSWVQ